MTAVADTKALIEFLLLNHIMVTFVPLALHSYAVLGLNQVRILDILTKTHGGGLFFNNLRADVKEFNDR